jgi:hypothetical protein
MDQIPCRFHISHSSIGYFSPRAGVIPNRDLATTLPGGNTMLLPGDRFQSLQSLIGPGQSG